MCLAVLQLIQKGFVHKSHRYKMESEGHRITMQWGHKLGSDRCYTVNHERYYCLCCTVVLTDMMNYS